MTTSGRNRNGGPLDFLALDEGAGPLDFLRHEDLPPTLPPGLADQGTFMDVGEAATRMGVSRVVVRSWIYRGQVVAVPDPVGRGRWLIGAKSLYDCELERRTAPGWDETARARREGRG